MIPIKLALMGAPGAGKSVIAKRLALNLNRDKTDRKWKVIDDYVPSLIKRTGRSYGSDADYPHNVQIMCERWTLEAEALHHGFSTITCGSIYETIIYAAMLHTVAPADEDEVMQSYESARINMQFLGLMEAATLSYNMLFYVPWDKSEHTWEAVVNAKIPEVIDAYGKIAAHLTGTPRQKVADALQIIRWTRDQEDADEKAFAQALQPAV